MAARFRDVLLASFCALVLVCCRAAPRSPAEASYRDAEAKFQSGDLDGAVAVGKRGVRNASGPDTSEYWRFLLIEAEALLWQGHTADALALLASDPPAELGTDIAARRATIQAVASNNLQRFDRAEGYLKTAQNLASRGTPELAIDIALADGLIGLAQGDLNRASDAFELALDRARNEHQPFLEVRARGELGLVEMRRHRFAAAVDWFQSALATARGIQARTAVAKLLGNLGWSYKSMGELERARELYTEAHDESRKLGAEKDVGIWLTNIGEIHASRREFASAESDFRSALDIARSLEDKTQTAIVLIELAAVMIQQGDLARATEYNDESLLLTRAIGDRNQEQAAILNSAAIAVGQQRPHDAERLFREIVSREAIDDAGSNLAHRAEAEAGLARMYAAAGDVRRAQMFFHNALQTMGV